MSGDSSNSQFDIFLSSVNNGLELTSKPKVTSPDMQIQSVKTEEIQSVKESTTENRPSSVVVEQPKRKRKSQEDYQGRFFTRVDFAARKPLYITAATHRRLMRIVHLMDSSKATISSYVENILLGHLEMFKEDIETIYRENSINPTKE